MGADFFHVRRFVDMAAVAAMIVVGGSGAYSLWYAAHPPRPTARNMAIIPEVIDEPLLKTTNDTTWVPATSSPDYFIPPIVNGMAPVVSHLPTKQKVVFLGIDDGGNKQAFELDLVKADHIQASLFLAERFIKDNSSFFTGFVAAGSLVEDHTVDHALLSHLSYADQKKEICDEADLQTKEFGRRPILFRPPGGDYNQDTQRAAAACGMKAVVLWIAKANGGSMQYQIGHELRPGDIVLMHFRPEFKQDMDAFVSAQNAAGLHTELLENWLLPS